MFLVLALLLAQNTGQVPPAPTGPQPCATAGVPAPLAAEPFASRSWYTPLIAEPRGAQSEVVFWGRTRVFPYMTNPDHLNVWEIGFGKELPVAAWETHSSLPSLLDCGGWGLGIWVPGRFHMIADAGDASIPILNLDYKLSAAFKVTHAVTPRDLLTAKVQIGHESTHIGDEFALRAIEEFGDAFQRINVSYEFIEVGVNWDHFFGSQRQHSLSLRGSGVQTLAFNGDVGWYAPRLMDGTPIQPSRVNFEPAVGVEYLPRGTHGWRPFVSFDGQLRTVYDYAKASADQREDRQFTSSVVVGVRNLRWASRGMPDVIAKYYWGVNPNGQFRWQSSYWAFGFGLLFRL